ncbi:hypothetical protein [Paenibacillus sp. JCM 10914]|nr:hypothetical protein [Paenibacillus sp. JCM 10914]
MYKVMKGLSVVSVIAGVLGAVIFILFIGSWLMLSPGLLAGLLRGLRYTL